MVGSRYNGAKAGEHPDGEEKDDLRPGNKQSFAEREEFRRGEQPSSKNQRLDRKKEALLPEEILSERLKEQTQLANARLRAQLTGSILIELTPSGKKFIFDWSGDNLTFGPCDGGQADCTIRLSGESLVRIAKGELNPQIAMLSDKLEVSGRLSLAIYFFNLIVPPSGLEKGHADGEEHSPVAG